MTGRRPTLLQLRNALLHECLDHEWITATECREMLGLSGSDWYRLTTALERLVVDGVTEIERPGSHQRRFRIHREEAA